ncbi:MAG: hypothetical protein SFY68_11355, partial [Candidatus Sumerlaeia bacterium]|nr:hypothetical protein [Candidatus Sumerlaeia bacterium]
MQSLKRFALAGALAALLTAPLAAQSYTVSGVTQALTVPEIQTALTNAGVPTANTDSLDGVELGAGNTVYIIHNNAGALTLAAIDLVSKTALWTKSEAQILTDLGLSGNLTLVGEVILDTTNNRLVLASDINAGTVNPATDPWTLFQVSLVGPSYTASTIVSSASIIGWNSHGVLNNGTIVGALGEEHEVLTGNEPRVGYINETTDTFITLFDKDDFIASTTIGGGDVITGELPPETIGIDSADNTIYVFGHDNFELFSIAGLSALDPTDIEITGWDDAATPALNRVDFHALDVDANGTVFGFD